MIIDVLHKFFPNLADLRMREIRIDKFQRRVSCVLSYPNVDELSASLRQQITDVVRTQIPKGYFCSVRFVDDQFGVNSFLKNLFELINKRYPIYSNIGKNSTEVQVEGRRIDVTFNVSAVTKKNMELSDFCANLQEYYAEYTCYEVNFDVREQVESPVVDVSEQEKLVQLAVNRELLRPSRYFSVSGKRMMFGKAFESLPMYISDLRNPMDNCTVCGTVSQKKCRQAKNNPLLQICSFTLTDATGGTIPCVLFVRLAITDVELIMSETGRGEAEARTLSQKRALANDKKMKDILWLSDSMTVAAHGKAVFGQNGQLELHVYDLCSCVVAPISPDKDFRKEPAESYLLIKPEPFAEFRQINFVSQGSDKSVLTGRECVVLHVNATGLSNPIEDKLFALCAVKLVNGHMTERLFSYINPERDISSDKRLHSCGVENHADGSCVGPVQICARLCPYRRGSVADNCPVGLLCGADELPLCQRVHCADGTFGAAF